MAMARGSVVELGTVRGSRERGIDVAALILPPVADEHVAVAIMGSVFGAQRAPLLVGRVRPGRAVVLGAGAAVLSLADRVGRGADDADGSEEDAEENEDLLEGQG